MNTHLTETVRQFTDSKEVILVIGDVMLDRYLIGNVNRISPEAPVPVVLLKQAEDRAGGAANVAANLSGLGLRTQIIGCIGNDDSGDTLNKLMAKNGIDISHMMSSAFRPTVNAALREPDRFRPLAERVIGPYKKIPAAADIRGDHVEPSPVVADRRRVDAIRCRGSPQRKLALPGEAMAREPPVHEVLAVMDRNTRKILEAAVDQKIVVPGPADARVRIKPRQNRVRDLHAGTVSGVVSPTDRRAFNRILRTDSSGVSTRFRSLRTAAMPRSSAGTSSEVHRTELVDGRIAG